MRPLKQRLRALDRVFERDINPVLYGCALALATFAIFAFVSVGRAPHDGGTGGDVNDSGAETRGSGEG